jgi:hypothetical protein
VNLSPAKYDNHFDVVSGERFVNGPYGARCSKLLKLDTRVAYQRAGDLHVFGFDAWEGERVEDFRENYPDLSFAVPLVEAGLTKPDCKAIIERAGIILPAMYRLGYANNNCVGCVKGGQGYWNRIRVDFPLVFDLMAKKERTIGHTILRHRKGPRKGEPLYLDELDPKAGRFAKDQPADCGPLCQTALGRVGLG